MGKTTNAKVLMVGPDLSLNGGIVSVVKGYYEAGLQNFCDKLDYCGTGVGSSLITKGIAFARSLASYKKVIGDYDIVHLHISARGSYKRKKIMAGIAESKGKKVILHEHSGEFARDFEAGGNSYRADVRETFGAADMVIVLSEEWRDYFAENVCDSSKLVVLHNGVSVPSESCVPCSHQDVLFLGRLDARKSPDVLLRASKEMLEAFPEAKLIFGGDGYPERYRAMAEELGIADKCEFRGWVSGEDKEDLFSMAGIYCLPSKNEGMPMSVMEAMAHGLPVITTAVGGVPQLIDNGVDGLLMDVDDVDQLSKLLFTLEDSPEQRTKLGLAGREKIKHDFEINKSVERLIGLYSKLFEGAHATSAL